MTDIPERAAWLDHEIEWFDKPPAFEVSRLGLDKADVVLLEGQVGFVYYRDGHITVVVRDVEITGANPVTGQFSYGIVGESQFSQGWEFGGASLTTPDKRTTLI